MRNYLKKQVNPTIVPSLRFILSFCIFDSTLIVPPHDQRHHDHDSQHWHAWPPPPVCGGGLADSGHSSIHTLSPPLHGNRVCGGFGLFVDEKKIDQLVVIPCWPTSEARCSIAGHTSEAFCYVAGPQAKPAVSLLVTQAKPAVPLLATQAKPGVPLLATQAKPAGAKSAVLSTTSHHQHQYVLQLTPQQPVSQVPRGSRECGSCDIVAVAAPERRAQPETCYPPIPPSPPTQPPQLTHSLPLHSLSSHTMLVRHAHRSAVYPPSPFLPRQARRNAATIKTLVIRVHAAEYLLAKDLNGRSDPVLPFSCACLPHSCGSCPCSIARSPAYCGTRLPIL